MSTHYEYVRRLCQQNFERFEAKISSQVQEELLNFLDEDDAPFSMVSLDNFNERPKYKVWHGDGSRGFDGATCMIIQPGPKSIQIPADQRTNLIKHTNTDFSLACIDTKLELHFSLFLPGNSDLSLSYVNGDKDNKHLAQKQWRKLIGCLFIT